MFEQVFGAESFALKASINPDQIVLRVQVSLEGQPNKIYETIIKDLTNIPILNKYCQDYEQVKKYLQQEGHQGFDQQKSTLIIYERNPIKKSKIISQTQLKMIVKQVEKQRLSQHKRLQKIFNKCNLKTELKSDQIKDLFETVALCIQQLSVYKCPIHEKQAKIETSIRFEDELYKIRKQMQDNDDKLAKKIEKIENLTQTEENNKKLMQLQTKINKITSDIRQIQDQVQIRNKQNTQMLKGQLAENMMLTQRIQQKLISFSIQTQKQYQAVLEIIKRKFEVLNLESWIDHMSEGYDDMQIVQNQLKARKYGAIVGSKKIVRSYQFNAKILKLRSKLINFGVAGFIKKAPNQKIKTLCQIRSNNDGYFLNINKIQFYRGTQFYENQTVTVAVNLESGKYTLKVDNVVRHEQICEKLKDKSITWYPFFCLNPQDTVEITE